MNTAALLLLSSIHSSFVTQEKLGCILERRLLLLFCLKDVLFECFSARATRFFRNVPMMVLVTKQ